MTFHPNVLETFFFLLLVGYCDQLAMHVIIGTRYTPHPLLELTFFFLKKKKKAKEANLYIAENKNIYIIIYGSHKKLEN